MFIPFFCFMQRLLLYLTVRLFCGTGQHYREERNKDVAEILNGTMHFGTSHLDPANIVDHTFFMGDLNYRMMHSSEAKTPEPSFDEQWKCVKNLVDDRDWRKLSEHDELLQLRTAGTIFADFVEGDTLFHPTFKMERKIGFSYVQQRVPAWCDRVLWRSLPHCKDDVRLLSYEPLGDIATSDHKPVQAIFNINLPTPAWIRMKSLERQLIPKQGCVIVFHEMSAYDMPKMDLGSENDCYIIFLNRALFHASSKFITKTKDNQANPHWIEGEIPLLPTRYSDLAALRNETLTLAILDADVVSDDIIGFAHLNLNDILDYQKDSLFPPFLPYKFTLPIYFKGLKRGVVSGSVEIQAKVVTL